MNLDELYKTFPDRNSCLKHLESCKWQGKPVCPYCNNNKTTPYKSNFRHHCNKCNSTYSVTVGTAFHKTKIDLQKWFYAIHLFNKNEPLTVRGLAEILKVNNNTANLVLMRLRNKKLLEFQNLNF